uniref:Galectin n=1 Tax=Gouania willdenowi TaxID=441366 RepID=A0A8C5HRS2_GOUWI
QAVPYRRNFLGGLHDGLLVIITGTPEQSVNRFTVNFETKEDIAFHFNPRFDEGAIIRNSCIQKKWGNEERELKDFPFIKASLFQIKIKCTRRGFEVFMKDAPLLTFKHRVTNLKSVTKLGIGRGAYVNSSKFCTGESSSH